MSNADILTIVGKLLACERREVVDIILDRMHVTFDTDVGTLFALAEMARIDVTCTLQLIPRWMRHVHNRHTAFDYVFNAIASMKSGTATFVHDRHALLSISDRLGAAYPSVLLISANVQVICSEALRAITRAAFEHDHPDAFRLFFADLFDVDDWSADRETEQLKFACRSL